MKNNEKELQAVWPSKAFWKRMTFRPKSGKVKAMSRKYGCIDKNFRVGEACDCILR